MNVNEKGDHSGAPGTPSASSAPGTRGTSGTPGTPGAPSASGTSSTPGAPSASGTPGTPGAAGTTGTEGASEARRGEAGAPPQSGERRTQAERSESTRGALVAAARRLFAERGYAGVGTEEIVRAAGVTRGALYHHFDGKRDLFEAVYLQIEAELSERIASGALAANADSPLDAMRAGAEMFLQACTEPEAQRIVLLDGPAVLGWDRWREIAAEHGLGLIEASLQAAVDAGAIVAQPVRPLAHVLMGALDEAAMLVARADDPEAMRVDVGRTLDLLLDGLAA